MPKRRITEKQHVITSSLIRGWVSLWWSIHVSHYRGTTLNLVNQKNVVKNNVSGFTAYGKIMEVKK